jgi:hypothetical protein
MARCGRGGVSAMAGAPAKRGTPLQEKNESLGNNADPLGNSAT